MPVSRSACFDLSFTAWKTLSDWIENHREQLKAGQDLEEAAQEWQAIGKPWSGLASGARLKRYRQAISPSDRADKFLRASQRRLWTQRGLAGLSLACLRSETIEPPTTSLCSKSASVVELLTWALKLKLMSCLSQIL